MIVIFEIAIAVWLISFCAAFLVEFGVNRRPVIVAALVTSGSFLGLLLWDWPPLAVGLGDPVISIYIAVAGLGFLPSLAGAGLARFIRLWNSEVRLANRDNPAEE